MTLTIALIALCISGYLAIARWKDHARAKSFSRDMDKFVIAVREAQTGLADKLREVWSNGPIGG